MKKDIRRFVARAFAGLSMIAVLLNNEQSLAAGPIALHPDNPHYFKWRGKAAVISTSGEHYGAVLNLDFNYRR